MLTLTQVQVKSILLLHKDAAASPENLLDTALEAFRKTFPSAKIGYGTEAFFTELNRNRPQSNGADFISYSINPQVHASDIRSLIENLEAQKYTIKTAKSFANGKAIYVSPVTLKWRYNPERTEAEKKEEGDKLPWNVDVRQATEFAAAWTLLSIKYLAEADSLTFYETVGMRGIMMGDLALEQQNVFPAKAGDLYPLYHLLRRLHSFQPLFILESQYPDPLSQDGLMLENAKGEKLLLEVDFEKGRIQEKKFPAGSTAPILPK